MICTLIFCAAKKRRFDARILLMNTLLTLARKELKDGLRNRWVLAIAILLAAFALTLAFLGSWRDESQCARHYRSKPGDTQYLFDSVDCALAFL